MDVVIADQVEVAAAATLDRFGGIDILVANAGITGPNAPTWEKRGGVQDRSNLLSIRRFHIGMYISSLYKSGRASSR